MPGTDFEKEHIVEFAEEAILQLIPDPENSFVTPYVEQLLKLITTTDKDDWDDEKYWKAEFLIEVLALYRNHSEIWFVPR
ncbi:MAG: hypothetical protein Fur0011_3700 [Candidatus Microgenomates bacterium]